MRWPMVLRSHQIHLGNRYMRTYCFNFVCVHVCTHHVCSCVCASCVLACVRIMCVCIMCVHVCTHHVCSRVYTSCGSRRSTSCIILSAIHFGFGNRAWSSLSGLDWLTSKPQGSFGATSPETGLQAYVTMSGFLFFKCKHLK